MNVIIINSTRNKIHGAAGNYLWRIHNNIYLGTIGKNAFFGIFDYIKEEIEKEGSAIFIKSDNSIKGFNVSYINEHNLSRTSHFFENFLAFLKKIDF